MSIVRHTVSFSEGPNPSQLIKTERDAQKVDPIKLHHFLEGSVYRSDKIKELQSQMERDPLLATGPDYYDTTKSNERQITATKIARVAQYLESETFEDFQLRLSLLHVFDPQVGTRIGVNLGLFLSCIRGNGTADQLGYWALNKEACFLKNIYGCFGMTELAHGSNVMALQTTATFDPETDEIVINTPHIGATKWWIGGAAHSATHCTVYARLISKGEDYGIKTFVVPLRDSNHKLMPGVTVGDIGSKMGRGGIDNGWIQFANVRIPRYYMLQKFAKITADGEVTLPPLEQLAYSALLGGRVMMVLDSYRIIAKVVTIALRYAIGRRQFHKNGGAESDDDEGGLEEQIINYPLHQRRLFPYLAAAYVASAAALQVESNIQETLAILDDAVDNDDEEGLFKGIESMKSLFLDSGALKSTLTWLGASAIDECRQACGGHGYSAYNAFGKTYDDWVVQCTWEGDNNILGVFTGKPIVKHVYNIIDNEKVVKGSCAYLNNTKNYIGDNWETPVITSAADVQDPKKFLTAIEATVSRASYSIVQTLRENGDDFDAVGPELKILSKLHAHRYLLAEFFRRIETGDQNLSPYLTTLGIYHGAHFVLSEQSTTLLQFNIVTAKVFSEINTTLFPQLLKQIRPHVVGLTDGFQQSDMLLNAPIGNYDGNIYENFFNTVKRQNPPVNSQAPYTLDFAAMLNRGSLEDRLRQEKSFEVQEILSKGIA